MSYAAGISTLKRLLKGLPEERAIERYRFEYRLERAQQKIERVPVPPGPRQWLTSFRGEPVQSNSGIDANFRAEAVTIASIRLTAASATGELKWAGQISRNALGQPIITGITLGSFGFVIELPPRENSNNIPNPSEQAINSVQELLRATLGGEDDELAIAAAVMHPRAVNKVAQFLKLMKDRRAQFTIRYEGNAVSFQIEKDVENAHRRLVEVNEDTRTDDVIGRMTGIIPATHQFQINPDDAESIRGTIDPDTSCLQYPSCRTKKTIRPPSNGRTSRYAQTARTSSFPARPVAQTAPRSTATDRLVLSHPRAVRSSPSAGNLQWTWSDGLFPGSRPQSPLLQARRSGRG